MYATNNLNVAPQTLDSAATSKLDRLFFMRGGNHTQLNNCVLLILINRHVRFSFYVRSTS